jgi:hypothetical protein
MNTTPESEQANLLTPTLPFILSLSKDTLSFPNKLIPQATSSHAILTAFFISFA